MKKITTQRTLELMKEPSFFEGIKLNYGSYNKAGKALHVDGKLLEKYSKKKERRRIPNRELVRMEKALNKLSLRKRETAEAYIFSSGMATPAQRRFMLNYAKKGEKQRQYIRKQINVAAAEQKNIIMPAMIASGEVKVYQNSPKIKRTRKRYSAAQRSRWPSSRKSHHKAKR